MSRERILARIRAANRKRDRVEHPGGFESWRALDAGSAQGDHPGAARERFAAMFGAAGGEVVRVPGVSQAAAWLRDFGAAFDSVAVGSTVDPALVPDLPRHAPRRADFGLSRARCAIAETGSLVLDARDGRRAQLLPPVHVVVLDATAVHATARDAFAALRDDLPSALGLHSGPSKSADIGQVMVKGVHGPGRLVALVVDGRA